MVVGGRFSFSQFAARHHTFLPHYKYLPVPPSTLNTTLFGPLSRHFRVRSLTIPRPSFAHREFCVLTRLCALDLLINKRPSRQNFLATPFAKMEAIQTHPSNAAQAKAFTAPGSLSFPGGAGDLTPPSAVGDKGLAMTAGHQQLLGAQVSNGTGVIPATPAATPAAMQGGSGLTPTLQ